MKNASYIDCIVCVLSLEKYSHKNHNLPNFFSCLWGILRQIDLTESLTPQKAGEPQHNNGSAMKQKRRQAQQIFGATQRNNNSQRRGEEENEESGSENDEETEGDESEYEGDGEEQDNV